MILITGDTNITINEASTKLKDKFVFYSPSIMFGLDFSISTSQKCRSILPSGSYQQTTRTRNIKKLFFYCNTKEEKPAYKRLNDVVEKITI